MEQEFASFFKKSVSTINDFENKEDWFKHSLDLLIKEYNIEDEEIDIINHFKKE